MGKHKRKHSAVDETIVTEEHHSNERAHKKKKKHKTEKMENVTSNDSTCKEVILDSDSLKQSQSDVGTESRQDYNEDAQVNGKQNDKKKKKKKHKSKERDLSDEDGVNRSQALEDSDVVLERKLELQVSPVETDDAHGKKKKKKKCKERKGEDNFDSFNGTQVKRFDKISGRKSDMVELAENTSMGVEQSDDTKGEKRKKKKKNRIYSDSKTDEKNSENGAADNLKTSQTLDKAKKKKSKKSEVEEDNVKKQIENKVICNDRPSTSKMELPQQSNPSPFAGQWNTASLGDSDRQNKFFRLLGGFKKDSDKNALASKFNLGAKRGNTSLNQAIDTGKTKVRGNTAMDKQQQEEYNKTMEKTYDRALTMNFNRGIGLGFQKPPEEGKKFHIDTNKSKSVKFDDSD